MLRISLISVNQRSLVTAKLLRRRVALAKTDLRFLLFAFATFCLIIFSVFSVTSVAKYFSCVFAPLREKYIIFDMYFCFLIFDF